MSKVNTDRLVDVFLDLVRLSSPSGDERAVADYIMKRGVDLGVNFAEDGAAAATGGTCGNLVGRLGGNGCDRPRILFAAHMDTVGPCECVEPVVCDGTIRSAGDTVLGGDDKAAIAALLEMMAVLGESAEACVPVIFCFTVSEEKGLLGARQLELDRLDAEYGFVPDADGLPGNIVVGAPTHITYKAMCRGKAAHAGIAPEQGVNAIQMAATAIGSLPQGKIAEDTTANVGMVNGGHATNVVPDLVEVSGEVRSHRPDVVSRLISEARETFKKAAETLGGEAEFIDTIEYETFHLPEDSAAVRLARIAAESCGLAGVELVSNGGSDASILNAAGIPTVVLATGTENVHSKQETVHIDRLESLADWLLAIVAEASRKRM